jgi:hypothetical protein
LMSHHLELCSHWVKTSPDHQPECLHGQYLWEV